MTTSQRTWCQASLAALTVLLCAVSADAQGYRELSVVPRLDTGIDLFAIDSAAKIEHRYRNDSEAAFAGSESLSREASDIAALALDDERYEVFIVDREQSLWHSWQPADSFDWTEWQLLDTATKKVSVARSASGRVELFTIGTDDAVWHRGREANAEQTAFGVWRKLELSGTQLSAAAAEPDGFALAVIGQDGALLVQSFGADGEPVAEPENLAGESFDVALAQLPGGGFSLVAVGSEDNLWERRYLGVEQGWLDWQSLPVSSKRVALVATNEGLSLFTLSNGAIASSQLTAADASWSEPSIVLEGSAPLDSELRGRARLIIPSLDVDQDVPVTIGLRFNVDSSVVITSFPTVVTESFDTPFGATTSTISLPSSGVGELRLQDGVLRLPVTLRFDQSLDLPIIAEDGNLALDLSSENAGGQLLDPSTGEVALSAEGSFQGDGATNPLDGQSCQVIVSGTISPAP
jgi:hypothetical protein